jgi:predicted transcriptional regulator
MGLNVDVTMTIRLSAEDVEKLDKLAAKIPSMSRTAVAREAMRRGLELFDEADKIREPAERDAAFARLAGMIGSQRRGRR